MLHPAGPYPVFGSACGSRLLASDYLVVNASRGGLGGSNYTEQRATLATKWVSVVPGLTDNHVVVTLGWTLFERPQ